MKRTILCTALVAAIALPASADTLYVAGPPPTAPGHPLRLGADHRANQVGDLITVQFNNAATASRAYTSTTAKGYNVNQGAGSGLLNLPLLRLGAGSTGQTASNASDSKADTSAFVTSMTATVTNVLPSGALQIEGDQMLLINGEKQKLHVIGFARPEDVDNTNTVSSTRLANVQATFQGNDTKDHKGLIRKVLDALF
jgi:flagellar L-ring protein precursor FlgH